MQSRKIINRRAFCAGILAASAVRASDPIVDLTKRSPPLILPQKTQTIFQRAEKEFIDLEPAVRRSSKQLFTPEILPNLYGQYLKLALRSVHTGEEMNLVVPKSLNVSNSAMVKFSHLCRDWRYNQAQNMDPGLIRILAKICDESKDDKRSISVEILSGFRTHSTNEMLRRRSVMVAKNSFHKLGKALDFRLPDIELPQTKASADRYAYGGLGVYKNFIHIDTGPQRRWIM